MTKYVVLWKPWNCYISKSRSNHEPFVTDKHSANIKSWKTKRAAEKWLCVHVSDMKSYNIIEVEVVPDSM